MNTRIIIAVALVDGLAFTSPRTEGEAGDTAWNTTPDSVGNIARHVEVLRWPAGYKATVERFMTASTECKA